MVNNGELVAVALIAGIAPYALHLRALTGSELRPKLEMQKTPLERALFRRIWLLFGVNGLLSALIAVLGHSGNVVPAVIAAALSVPTVLAQLVCLVLAKSRSLTSDR
jgi:hypothetical protein